MKKLQKRVKWTGWMEWVVNKAMLLFSRIKKFIVSFRDRISEYSFALIVYAGLATLSVILCSLVPLLFAKAAVLFGLCILLSLITTIRYRYGDVSETNIAQSRREKEALEKQLREAQGRADELEDRLKREKHLFFGMSWVLEITVAEARGEFRKTFDHYIAKDTDERVPWKKRPANLVKGDKRTAGSLVIPYIASISIDLRQVQIELDAPKRTARFSIPEPLIRVRPNGESITDELRLELEFDKPMIGKGSWILHDKLGQQHPVWEKETKEAFDTVLATDLTDAHLGESVKSEVENRVAHLLNLLTGFDVTVTTTDKLQYPKLLSAVWPNLASPLKG